MTYLTAGTDGPLPVEATSAASEALKQELADGRWMTHFEARRDGQTQLREEGAKLYGCDVSDVALTTSTSEGLGKVLAGLRLGPGDEIVTSDNEHPGLLGPLIAARRAGVEVRTAPLTRIAEAVTASTTVVACSHVSWATGEVCDPGLADLDIPVVLDGAEGIGAVKLDMAALGCDAYAGSGQKWLCGADGTGLLYISAQLRERVEPLAPAYLAFADTLKGLESPLHDDARRYDTPSLSREEVAMTLASVQLLGSYGWDAVFAESAARARKLAQALAERGFEVAPRADTTLVSWDAGEDAKTAREGLTEKGVIVRDIPGTRYLRASVGAWNDDTDLDRLLEAL